MAQRFLVRGAIPHARAWAVGLASLAGLSVAAALFWLGRASNDVVNLVGAGSLISVFVGVWAYRGGLQRALTGLRTPSGELALGTDGLSWKASGASATFVPWAAVDDVEVTAEAAIVRRNDGQPLHIRTGGGRKIAREVLAAKAAWAARSPTEIPLSLGARDRGGAPASENDYRAGAEIDPDVLVRVAEDPLAPPRARVDALLRLPPHAHAARARVRVAVDDVLRPEVRAALEAGLEGAVSDEQLDALDATAEGDAPPSQSVPERA